MNGRYDLGQLQASTFVWLTVILQLEYCFNRFLKIIQFWWLLWNMHMQHYCRLLKEDTRKLSEREVQWYNGVSKLLFKACTFLYYFFLCWMSATLCHIYNRFCHIMSCMWPDLYNVILYLYPVVNSMSTVCQPWLFLLSLLLIWTIKDYIINFGLKPQQSVGLLHLL